MRRGRGSNRKCVSLTSGRALYAALGCRGTRQMRAQQPEGLAHEVRRLAAHSGPKLSAIHERPEQRPVATGSTTCAVYTLRLRPDGQADRALDR